MKTNLLLLSLFLFFGSCSDPLENGAFEGDWYVVGENNLGYNYWNISLSNIVEPFSHNSEYSNTYKLSKDINNKFTLISDYGRVEEIGDLKIRKQDTISFTSGLKLIRLKTPTKSDLTIAQLRELLSNSILKYEFDDMKTSLYLSDSLRVSSNYLMNTSLIREGYFERASLGESWVLESFKGVYVLYHSLLYGIENAGIVINEASEKELKGTLFISGLEFPITILVTSKLPLGKIQSINNHFVTTDWETKRTSIFDYSKEYPDVIIEEEEELIMEANPRNIGITIKREDIEKNPFTFKFEEGNLNL